MEENLAAKTLRWDQLPGRKEKPAGGGLDPLSHLKRILCNLFSGLQGVQCAPGSQRLRAVTCAGVGSSDAALFEPFLLL